MRAFLIAPLALLLLVTDAPRDAEACGPRGPMFFPASEEPTAIRDFVAGDLGVVSAHWDRRYLLVVWRVLSGRPLDDDERAAFEVAAPAGVTDFDRAKQRWLALRARVVNSQPGRINPARRFPSSYAYYDNCKSAGFLYAADTLESRLAIWSETSPEARAWVASQDAVFANCGGGRSTPPALPEGAPALLEKDHEYQMAAALFYGNNPTLARDLFDKIALDPTSSHARWASYLAARAEIRRGRGQDRETLSAALVRIDAILADPAQATIHDATRGLRDLVSFRLDPNTQRTELTERLAAGVGADTGRVLRDWERVMDRIETGQHETIAASHALVDWVVTTHGSNVSDAYDRARARHAAEPGDLWLVPAMIHAEPTSEGVGELLAAVRERRAESPAGPTLYLHAIRLHLARGESAAARRLFAQVNFARLKPSTRNAFHAAGLALARNLGEWVRHAPRSVSTSAVTELHADARNGLRAFPLSVLLRLSRESRLDDRTRTQIAAAGFVRAVILEDHGRGRAFAQRLRGQDADLDTDLAAYRSAPARDRSGLGALVVLRHESFFGEPSIQGEFPTHAQPCGDARCRVRSPAYTSVSRIESSVQALSAAQRRAFESERAVLEPIGRRLDGLGTRVLEWADARRDHPRVPEALHHFVRRTRRASVHHVSGPNMGALSQGAFDRLHERYPTHELTGQTRYWYR